MSRWPVPGSSSRRPPQNLSRHAIFTAGTLTTSHRRIRRFALAKVVRNLNLAAEPGARTYVFRGGREGAGSGAGKDIRTAPGRSAEALNVLCGHGRNQRLPVPARHMRTGSTGTEDKANREESR